MGCIPLGYVLIFPLLFSFFILIVIVFHPKKKNIRYQLLKSKYPPQEYFVEE